jgi:hypothetical protein
MHGDAAHQNEAGVVDRGVRRHRVEAAPGLQPTEHTLSEQPLQHPYFQALPMHTSQQARVFVKSSTLVAPHIRIKCFAFQLAGQKRTRPISVQDTAFGKIHCKMQTSANKKNASLCFLPGQLIRKALYVPAKDRERSAKACQHECRGRCL